MIDSTGQCIVIDGRVNGRPGAHGLARSLMGLVEHLGGPDAQSDVPVKLLVNSDHPQIFPLEQLNHSIQLLDTDISPTAIHRGRAFSRLLKDAGAGVLWIPYHPFTPLVCPCPLVLMVHDCILESDPSFSAGRRNQVAFEMLSHFMFRRATALTAPTMASINQIARYYPSAPPVTLVPNGVDSDRFASADRDEISAARSRFDLPECFVLTVGAHRPHKNHTVLVKALAQMPDWVHLVIVGQSDPRFAYPVPQLVEELGLQDRVRFLEDVESSYLPGLYAAARVFAFPSLMEGFGIPPIEAMAAHVPVVASAIPAVAEVCRSGAVLVSPFDPTAWSDALTQILYDEDHADNLRKAGSGVAAEADWKRGGKALYDLLAGIVSAAA